MQWLQQILIKQWGTVMVVDYLSNNSYTMSMKSHLLLLVVQTLVITVAGQTSVVWNSDTAIQTGNYEIIVGGVVNGTLNSSLPLLPGYSYTITYPSVVNFPSAAAAINSLEIKDNINNRIFFSNILNSTTPSSFQGVVLFNGTTGMFMKMKISIIVCDESTNTFLKLRQISWSPTNASVIPYFSGMSTGTGYRYLQVPVTRSTPLDLSHSNFQLPFLKSFSMEASSDGKFELGIRFQNIDSATYHAIFWTSGDCKVYYADYFHMTFDQTIIEASENTFSDAGTVEGKNGVQTTNSSMVAQKLTNFMIGINFLTFDFLNNQKSFEISVSYPNIITTSSNYTNTNFSYFNFRVRECPVTEPLYYKVTQMCYPTCPDGSFLAVLTNTFCTPCHPLCATCNSTPTCRSCAVSDFRQLDASNLCVCKAGYFNDSSTTVCGSCSSGCIQCTNATSCQNCNASQGVYLNGTSEVCESCGVGCSVCASLSTCATCKASDGYYLNTSNSVCVGCDIKCLTCHDEFRCITCNNSDWRSFNSTTETCDCIQEYYDNGSKTCARCGAYCLVCNATQCSQCYPTYVLDPTNTFICEQPYVPPPPVTNFTFEILSVIKEPTANNLTYELKIANLPPQLIGTNLALLFDFNVPNNSIITATYNQDTQELKVQVYYSQSLQSNIVNITLSPQHSGLASLSTSSSTVQSTRILSRNNLGANYYPESLYATLPGLDGMIKASLSFMLIATVMGSYSGKLIATQMIGVVQLAAVGLTLIHYGTPLLWPFRHLKYAHGLNIPITSYQASLPTELTWMGYYNSLSNNLNLMLLICLTALLVSLTFFIIQKVAKQNSQKERFWKFFNLAIGQYLLITMMFCLYQFSVSIPIFIKYPSQGGRPFVASIIEILLFLAVFGGCIALFVLKNQTYFGEFKEYFQKDTFSQLYYLFPILERGVIGLLMGSTRDSFAVGIITIFIQAGILILVAMKRPYLQPRENIRVIINYTVSILIIAILMAISDESNVIYDATLSKLYVPYAVIILLFLEVMMSLGYIIWRLVQKIKEKVEQSKAQQTTNLFTMESLELERSGEIPEIKEVHEINFDQPMEPVIQDQVQYQFDMPKMKKRRRRRNGNGNGNGSTMMTNQVDENEIDEVGEDKGDDQKVELEMNFE